VRDIPARIDPLQLAKPDNNTIVLWRFEEGIAKDSSVLTNHGKTRGEPEIVDGGKHGKCVELSGGEEALFMAEVQGFTDTHIRAEGYSMCVQFWCRFDEPRQSSQCLFDLGTSAGEPAARVEIDPQDRLVLSGYALPRTVSEKPVPKGQWFHLVLQPKRTYQPNRVYGDKTGAEILLNGSSWVRSYTNQRYYQFPPANTVSVFSLGNALTFDKGFRGRIDEFHFSSPSRSYYRVIKQDWLDPKGERAISRLKRYYRDPASLAFHAPFDHEADIKAVDPPEDVRESGESGPGHAVTAADDIETDAPEMEDEDDLEKELGVGAIKPLLPVPGVRGNGLLVRGGSATMLLPEETDFRDGTIEFWIKPGNWDNLTIAPSRHSNYSYRDSSLHLLTLYGEPRDGEGDAIPLVSVRGYRLEGKIFVSEEYAKYYPNLPPVPLQPYRWTHVALYWGKKVQHYQPRLYFDAKHVGYGLRTKIAKKADAPEWEKYRPAFIEFGNHMVTSFDEIRVYPYAFVEEEIQNSIAEHKGQPLQDVGAAIPTYHYRFSIGKMDLTVSLTLLNAEQARRAEVEFELPHENRTVNGVITDLEGGKGTVTLDVGTLPEGDYPVRGRILDGDGKELGKFESTFNRMPLPWLNNKFGILDTPPRPFTPVEREANKVSVVLREHTVADDSNFEAVTVKGEQVLAAPIRFEITSAGKSTTLKAEGTLEFGDCNKVEANWKGTAVGPGLKVTSDVRLEYDGMAKYHLVVSPMGREVTVDRLSLKIPLKKKYAQLIHVLPVGGNMRGYETACYLWYDQGLVWDSKTWSSRGSVTKMAAGNFIPMVWLGGMIRGFCWFADNDKGWVPNDDQPALTVTREQDTVVIRVHFISDTFTLKEPRRIVYGFMGTPPKPLHKHYRNWGRRNLKKYGPVAGRITSCDSFAPWDVPCRDGAFDFWPLGYDWEFAKMASNRQRVSKHGKYPSGQVLMLYHDKRFVPHGRDAQYFGWEWIRNGQGAWPQSKIDCLAWYMEQWFGRNIMDGIYIDDTFPIADYNWETGAAYKLPDGRIQPGAVNFAYRRYLKRMYSILDSHGKPPVMTSHMSCTMVWPYHSFFTVIYDGEGVGRFRSLTTTFLDAWPLDRLLTLDVAERTGLVSRVMLKSEYAERGKDEEAWAHMIWRTNRSAAAAWLLFDMNMPVRSLGTLLDPYYEEDVTVLPFWRNKHVVAVDPLDPPVTDEKLLPKRGFWRNRDFWRSLGTQPFRVTIYRKPTKALLVVVNYLRATKEATVRLDLDALEIPEDRGPALRAVDVDTWKEPTGMDIQRTKAPSAEEADVGVGPQDAPEEEVDVEADLGLKKKKPTYGYKDGTLKCLVKDHNFRIFELRWSEADVAELEDEEDEEEGLE